MACIRFRGKTFPLVYPLPPFFASRTAQALIDPEEARSQIDVDDPALSMVGAEKLVLTEGSVPMLWWLVLGLKLSWKKGYFGNGTHDWIGVSYSIGAEGPTMELPPAYLKQTLELLRPLCAPRGTHLVKLVKTALGKAARIGYIVPEASSFIASLWAAYAAGRRQAEEEATGTPKHPLPTGRCGVAAKWCCRMIEETLAHQNVGSWALRRAMGVNRDKLVSFMLPALSVDASP